MKIEIFTISGKTDIFTDRFIAWLYQILKIEKDCILLNFFNFLEQSWVQGTLLNIEAYSIYFLWYIYIELMFFD